MWAALDDFDSFFNTQKRKEVPRAPIESAPNTYDKKVSAILNKTLNSRNNLLEYIGEAEQAAAAAAATGAAASAAALASAAPRRSYIPFRNRKERESIEGGGGGGGGGSVNGVSNGAELPDVRLDGLIGKRSRRKIP